ncbi:hypothetical protein KCP69_04540 [Salmonella enterica subsp. enterica]|nr:hypothetical protein KCP69_04540 [Salmonella enterica subsp. enterica]
MVRPGKSSACVASCYPSERRAIRPRPTDIRIKQRRGVCVCVCVCARGRWQAQLKTGMSLSAD